MEEERFGFQVGNSCVFCSLLRSKRIRRKEIEIMMAATKVFAIICKKTRDIVPYHTKKKVVETTNLIH